MELTYVANVIISLSDYYSAANMSRESESYIDSFAVSVVMMIHF